VLGAAGRGAIGASESATGRDSDLRGVPGAVRGTDRRGVGVARPNFSPCRTPLLHLPPVFDQRSIGVHHLWFF
jgi:hypothetical protein